MSEQIAAVLMAQGLPLAEDARFGMRQLQMLWPDRARVLLGFDVAQGLAVLDDLPDQALVLVADSAWVSPEGRCVPRLQHALATGADVAWACDAQHVAPMTAPDYATWRGMERFVDAQPPGLAVTEAVHAPGCLGLATKAGWRRYLAAQARVVRVGGAWAHDAGNYFAADRREVFPLLPPDIRRLVDVGGGEGGFLAAVRSERPQVQTQLVELTPEAAGKAALREGVDAVWVGSFLDWQPQERFDCISFLEVLEHMVDPELALRHAKGLLSPGGCMVLSIPNVGHWSVVADLLEGRWDWAPSGIHCYTHVRFFTRKSIEDMLARVGLRAEAWLPVMVPGPAKWLDHWQQSTDLAVDVAALDVYAFGVRVVVSGD